MYDEECCGFEEFLTAILNNYKDLKYTVQGDQNYLYVTLRELSFFPSDGSVYSVWSKSMALPNPVTVASMNAMGKRLQAVFSTKEPLEVKLWSFNDIF